MSSIPAVDGRCLSSHRTEVLATVVVPHFIRQGMLSTGAISGAIGGSVACVEGERLLTAESYGWRVFIVRPVDEQMIILCSALRGTGVLKQPAGYDCNVVSFTLWAHLLQPGAGPP